MLPLDSPATRWILVGAVLGLVVLLTIRAIRRDRREYRRFKRYRTTKRRVAMMRKWLRESFLVFGISSVALLLLAGNQVGPLLASIDQWAIVSVARRWLETNNVLAWGVLLSAVIAFIVLTAFAVRATRHGEEVPTVGDIHALLPRNRAELPLGAALSINAGIVEELLFRFALPAALFGATGSSVVAVVGSVLLFGLLHAYQGVGGVVATSIVGGLLMLLFIGTGSIVAAIVVHALFDLRSLVLIPVLVYRVHRVPGTTTPIHRPSRTSSANVGEQPPQT